MSKKKKIITACIVIATLIVVAIAVIVKMGVFDASNYKYLNYDKYVTLGKYKGLEYHKEKVNVTKEEVDKEIEQRLSSKTKTETLKTGKVKEGDIININYKGTMKGKPFEGGSANGQDLTIGSHAMIDGFESGLVGKKVGSTVTLKLKFPKSYPEKDVAGKKVEFEVKINSKKVMRKPDYDLKFVKENTKFKTKKAYEASVRGEITKMKERAAETQQKSMLWNQIVSKSKVKSYPEKQLKFEKETQKKNYEQVAKNYNMTLDKMLKQEKVSKKDFDKQLEQYAKTVVKQKLVMYDIAKKEDIKVSDKAFNKYLKTLLKDAGFTESSFKSQYKMSIEDYADEHDFRSAYMMDKVLDKVMELGKAV